MKIINFTRETNLLYKAVGEERFSKAWKTSAIGPISSFSKEIRLVSLSLI